MSLLRWRDQWQLLFYQVDRRSLVLGSLAFLLNLAFGCGMASANALFVSRVGTDYLFFIYLGGSILTFLLAAASYLWVQRHSRIRLFFLSSMFFAGVVFLFWFLIGRFPHARWPVFGIRILSDVFFVLSLLQFWLLAGDYFTNLESRLRFPLFVAATGLGYMTGGWLLEELAPKIQALHFLSIWGGILAILPCLLALLPRSVKPGPEESHPREIEAEIPASTGGLLRVLFLFWFAFTFLVYGVDYLFNSQASQSLRDENSLAAFYGRIAFFSLLAVFLFQLLMAGPLSRVLSVHRSVRILCFALFVGAVLAAWNPSLAAVAFAEGLMIYFLDSAAVSVLQPVGNLFPDRMRGKAKVLLDGFAPSIADLFLIAVAFGLIATAVGAFRLGYVLAGVSLAFLLFPWIFRRAYRGYLRDCLNSREPGLVLNAVQALGERDEAVLAPDLVRLLDRAEGLNLKRNIILSLGRMRSQVGLPRLIEQFNQGQEALQLAVVEALGNYRDEKGLLALHELMKSQENVSFQVRMDATRLLAAAIGEGMMPVLIEALSDRNPRLQANAIESLALLGSARIVPLVLPFLESSHRRLKANAAVALFPHRAYRGLALKAIGELFASPDGLSNLAGVYAVGELRLRYFVPALEKMRKSADPRADRALVSALAKIGVRQYVEAFGRYLDDEEEVVAWEALQRLARFPRASRWRVFESISKWEISPRRRAVQRLAHSPFDFTQEIALLSQGWDPIFLQKR